MTTLETNPRAPGFSPLSRGPAIACGTVSSAVVIPLSSDQPASVLLDDLAVELDPPAVAEVLDDVPVQRRLVLSAQVGEAEAERHVHGAVDLLVEERVLHVARDAGVAADPELAEPA